jgi:DNA-binding FadR family transcriptional regulator
MFIVQFFGGIYTFYMETGKTIKKSIQHRKTIRKEKRLTVRFHQQLYTAIEARAYEESKTVSAVIIEAVRKHLDFKMPPIGKIN